MKSLSHKLFKKIDGIELHLHIVITKGEIHVGLVRHERDVIPQLLFSEFSRFFAAPGEYDEVTIEQLHLILVRTIGQLGVMYEQSDLYDSHQSIHEIFVSISPEFCDIHEHPVVLSFPRSKKITQEDIAYMPEADGVLLSRTLSEIKLNGYAVKEQDVIGLEAPAISYLEEVHIVSDRFIENIREVCAQHIGEHQEHITCTSHLDSQIRSLTRIDMTGEEFTLFVFGLEDSYVYQHGGEILYTESNYGQHEYFTELQQNGVGYDLETTASEMRLFNRGDLLEERAEKIKYVTNIESSVITSVLEESGLPETWSKPLIISTRPENRELIDNVLGGIAHTFIKPELYEELITHIDSVHISSLLAESIIGQQSRKSSSF